MTARVEAPALGGFWRGVARLWRFDLQRFRVVIALAMALELLRAVFVEWALHHASIGFATTANDFQVLDISLWLSAAVTTAVLVQADHPTDDRAFWRSRPITARQVAVAKLTLLVALFVFVPFAVNAARLVAYGAPASSLFASAVQFVVIGGAVVVPAWLLALLARTLARFLATAAAVVLAWYAAVTAIATFGPAWLLDPRMYGGGTPAYAPPLTDWQRVDERGWMVALTVTLLAVAAVVGCYSARRIVAPMLSAAAAALAGLVMPPQATRPPVSPDAAALAAGQVTIDGALEMPDEDERAAIARRGGRVPVGGRLVLRRAPAADLSSSLTVETARLSIASRMLEAQGVGYCCDADEASDAQVVLGRDVGASATRPRNLSRAPSAWMTLTSDAAGLIDGKTVDVQAAVRLRFVRHRLVGRLPVQAGSAFRGQGYLLEVVSIDERMGTAGIRLSRFPSLARVGPTLRLYRDFSQYTEPLAAAPWAPHAFGFERRGGGPSHGRDWVTGTTLPVMIWFGDAERPQRARSLAIVESTPIGELDSELAARVPVRAAAGPFSLGRRF